MKTMSAASVHRSLGNCWEQMEGDGQNHIIASQSKLVDAGVLTLMIVHHRQLARILPVEHIDKCFHDNLVAAVAHLTCLAQVLETCDHRNVNVRAAAVRALPKFCHRGDIRAVAKALGRLHDRGHSGSEIQGSRFSARGNRRKRNGYPVKEAAAKALSEIAFQGDAAVLNMLLAHVADPNPYVRCAIIDAVRVLSRPPWDPSVIVALGNCVEDVHNNVRDSAFNAICELAWVDCNPDIACALTKCFCHSSADIRNEAQRILAAAAVLNDDEIVEAVAIALQHKRSVVRCVAAQAMCTVASKGNKDAVAALIGCRRDPNARVREAIITALGQLTSPDDERSLFFLISCFKDWNHKVQKTAAQTLSELGVEFIFGSFFKHMHRYLEVLDECDS